MKKKKTKKKSSLFNLEKIDYKANSVINEEDSRNVQFYEDLMDIFDPIEFDNDERLLLIYAFTDETAIFSTDESFYRKVIQWESDNNLNSYLSDRVFDVLTKLSNKGILKEEYYNYLDEYSARYILQAHDYKRLKKFLLEKQDRISTVIEKYKMPVMVDPFADNNLDESELPF